MESPDVPNVFVYDYKYLSDSPSLEDQRCGVPDVPDVFVYDYKYLSDNPSLENQRNGIPRCSRRICV